MTKYGASDLTPAARTGEPRGLQDAQHHALALAPARAALHSAQADLARSRNERAHQSAVHAAALFQAADAWSDEVIALAVAAVSASRLGRAAQAVEWALYATQLAGQLPNGPWLAAAYGSLGCAYGWGRSFARAQEAFAAALQHASRSNPGGARLDILVEQLGVECFRLAIERDGTGSPPDLEPLARLLADGQALLADSPHVGKALGFGKAMLACWTGRLGDARAQGFASGAIAGVADAVTGLGAASEWLALELALQAGDGAQACAHADRMVAAATEAQHEPLACLGHVLAAQVHESAGRADLAVGALRALAHRREAPRSLLLESRGDAVRAQVAARQNASNHRALALQAQEFERLAFEDTLTGIPNLRRFQQRLAEWAVASADTGQPLCAALIDVDRFSWVNNNFGHPAGDKVLRTIAALVCAHVRDTDLPARLGGDEFAILFRNADMATATQVCERIEQAVREHDWDAQAPGLHSSISIGVVQARAGETVDQLVKRSDDAMFARKQARSGRAASLPPTVPVVPPLLLDRVVRLLQGAKSVVIFTGSGQVATGALNGIGLNFAAWSDAQRRQYAHAEGFSADPRGFLAFWQDRRREAANAKPSATDLALVELSRLCASTTFVTERVDGRLGQAGAGHVVELYGNVHRSLCTACGASSPALVAGRCRVCNGELSATRPDITLLGEPANSRMFAGAELAAKRADVVLVVDTDANILPGASLLDKARVRGAKVIMLGAATSTAGSSSADIALQGSAEGLVQSLVLALRTPTLHGSAAPSLSDDGFSALCYLSGHGTDHKGRTLEQTLAWADWEVEHQFDSLQWQFPLLTTSGVCPDAPVLTPGDFAILAANDDFREGLRRAFVRMLAFYGFEWRAGRVERAGRWTERMAAWTSIPGHNDLRISRILGALTLGGMREEARSFLGVLEAEVPRYRRDEGRRPLSFWRAAVSG